MKIKRMSCFMVAIFLFCTVFAFPGLAEEIDGSSCLSITNTIINDSTVSLEMKFHKPDSWETGSVYTLVFNLDWDKAGTIAASNVSVTDTTVSQQVPMITMTTRADVAFGNFIAEAIPDEFSFTVSCDLNSSYDVLYIHGLSFMESPENTIATKSDVNSAAILPEPIEVSLSGTSTPTSIPDSSIDNRTGSTATVTSSVSDGTATLNVASEKACVVAYTTDDGETYNRLTATVNSEGGYDFVVPDYSESMKFVVAVKGDVNGDGLITAGDWGTLVEAYNGAELSALNGLIGDVNGDGQITSTDWGTLVEAYNGSALSWNN